VNTPNCRETAASRSVSSLWMALTCVCMCACVNAAGAATPPLTACRSITDVAARVACYDRLADQQAKGAAQPAQSPAQVAQPSSASPRTAEQPAMEGGQGPQPKPSAAANTVFGADANARERPHRPREQVLQLERITRSASGKLLILTREGSTWIQSDDRVLANLPKPGSPVTIRSGALGSYFCVLQRSPWIRCQPRP